jgi:putative DNA primase/helicase
MFNNEMTLAEAALAYARAGWAIFPLWGTDENGQCLCPKGADCPKKNAGKHPLTDQRLGLTNGLKHATVDIVVISLWWDTHPLSNIGLATGEISGVDGLDIDTRGGGFDTWQFLRETHGEIPESTPSTRTGSGGRHFFFAHAEGLGNSAGRIGEGVDVRGDGGYVILPPSVSGSGIYSWVVTPDLVDQELHVVCESWPDWLLDAARNPNSTSSRGPSTEWKNGPTFQEGGRNSKLTSNAGTLRRRGWDEAEIYTALSAFNQQRCVPPLPEAEVQSIASSVMSYTPSENLYEWTDLGNTRRMVKEYGADLRYCFGWKKWLCWTGKRWAWDNSGEIMRRAKYTTDMILAEAEAIEDGEERDKQKKYGRKCQSSNRLDAMVKLATSEPDVLVDHTALDAHPYLLNVRNGTINLRTGELQPHNPDNYLTTMIDVDYDPNAQAPLWERVVSAAMLDKPELVDFIRRSLGYQVTGSVDEDRFFLWWGSGANAKSTIQEALLDVLGPYAGVTDPNLLMESRSENHPTGLADLFGKRIVFAQETGFGRALNETLVKQLTGGDRVKARRMREDFWEFNPTHKLVIVTNHKPQIRDNGAAFWRRVVVVPFRRVFAPDQQDRHLPAKLIAERQGILAWLVRGCLEWQTEGLNPPADVLEAIEEYRLEQDILGAWLAAHCEEGTNYETETSLLHEDYREWLQAGGWKNLPTIQIFSMMLTERGYTKTGLNGRSVRQGIRLKSSALNGMSANGRIPQTVSTHAEPRQMRFDGSG